MALHEVKSEIPLAGGALVADALLEHGWENWSVLEDVISGQAWVIGICPSEAIAAAEWPQVEALARDGGVLPATPSMRHLGDADWRDSYKAHFHAWNFGPLHWVPVWERGRFTLPDGHAVLWLDPGLAFGTGNHETTRLCVERLVSLAATRSPASRVVDAGCGSGILALSALLLGYRDVRGFDNDPEAVRVSGENALLNGLAGRLSFSVDDLVTGLTGASADVLLANIQADVLMRFADLLVAAVAPGGSLVLSGILASENARVCATFADLTPGWVRDTRVMGEWSDVLLQRPA